MNRPHFTPFPSRTLFGADDHVDAEALRRARQGTPTGEYHVDAEALRRARQGTPTGEYHVDAV
jgi:hypothetical protein